MCLDAAAGRPLIARAGEAALFFFTFSSALLALVLLTFIVGAAGCGLLVGRSLRESWESVSESFVLQAALLGFMALILALPYRCR